MAVGLSPPAALAAIAGVEVGTAALGGRARERDDLVVFRLAAGGSAAAVFTRSAFRAAPVQVASRHLAGNMPRCLLVNAGNANAATGERGVEDALHCCALAAEACGCAPGQVLPFSTGVIGEYLDRERFAHAVPAAAAAARADGWLSAARAIMTTDTVPKGISVEFTVGATRCAITGIAKGAGMIRPDMATMLAFVATDAAVAPVVLDQALRAAVSRSFNRVTVDGDTSTNDSCVVVATGASGAPPIEAAEGADWRALGAALDEVCRFLAQALIRDAEGASRFITVVVDGGREEAECLAVAYAVAHSPLVKTALFAGDANWGRIVAAIGRAGVDALDPAGVDVALNGVAIVAGGGRAPEYREAAGSAAVAGEEVEIRIGLGRGTAAATVWTSDLSHDYVTINAEYRS